MGYNKEVAYLPSDFNVYSDFSDTYGFDMTYSETDYPQGEGEFVYLNWDADPVVGIANFDVMVHQYLYYSEVETSPVETTDFEVDGQPYQLEKRLDGTYYSLDRKGCGRTRTDRLQYPRSVRYHFRARLRLPASTKGI